MANLRGGIVPKITKEGIDRWFDNDIFTDTRTLYMGSADTDGDGKETGTDFAMCESMAKGLHVLDAKNNDPITIIMNNLGGDEYHGYGIIDSMKACSSDINIVVRGHAMSMGAIILQFADHRTMSPNSRLMIHYGEWPLPGNVKNQERWFEECQRMSRKMEDIFLDRINKKRSTSGLSTYKRQQLQRKIQHDWILSADECIEWGLADDVEEWP
jgi:ATP-dependent protease ClpP protease subunit